ncbi:MAG: helix-turn-helix domain containing protein [Actinomycetota bacterium]|nr:helix-turn-helix domain containing protein [Actinomycetota bacterium]
MTSDEMIDISEAAAADDRPSRRELQAEQTRNDILDAASKCFAADGYGPTSVKQIADVAHVSVQTIYDSIGRKPDLIRELHRMLDQAQDPAADLVQLAETDDAQTIVRIAAQITRRAIEADGDLVRACHVAVTSDPALRSLGGHDSRTARSVATEIAKRLDELSGLRPTLTLHDASTSIAMLSDRRAALTLLDEHALDLDEIESWIADMIARTVLSSSARLSKHTVKGTASEPTVDLTGHDSPAEATAHTVHP